MEELPLLYDLSPVWNHMKLMTFSKICLISSISCWRCLFCSDYSSCNILGLHFVLKLCLEFNSVSDISCKVFLFNVQIKSSIVCRLAFYTGIFLLYLSCHNQRLIYSYPQHWCFILSTYYSIH